MSDNYVQVTLQEVFDNMLPLHVEKPDGVYYKEELENQEACKLVGYAYSRSLDEEELMYRPIYEVDVME